jgi:predicted dehydrogenase
MTTRVGVGVVGVNQRIRRAILSGIAASRRGYVAGIVSRDMHKAIAAAAEFGGQPFGTIDDLIADPAVQVVFICTPHALHHPMSLAVLRARKAVICEKPLAETAEQAEELATTAASVGVPTAVNFTYHSLPGHRFVAEMLAHDEIGALRHLDLSYWQARQKLPNAVPGNALLEIGSHEVDLARWWGEAGGSGDIIDVAGDDALLANESTGILTALGRTSAGAAVVIQANRVASGWRNGMTCRLVGERGTIVLNFDTDQTEIRRSRFGEGAPEGTFQPVSIPDEFAISYADFPGFHVDRLLASLGGEIQFPDFYYGWRCQRVLDALRRAFDEHRWISLC